MHTPWSIRWIWSIRYSMEYSMHLEYTILHGVFDSFGAYDTPWSIRHAFVPTCSSTRAAAHLRHLCLEFTLELVATIQPRNADALQRADQKKRHSHTVSVDHIEHVDACDWCAWREDGAHEVGCYHCLRAPSDVCRQPRNRICLAAPSLVPSLPLIHACDTCTRTHATDPTSVAHPVPSLRLTCALSRSPLPQIPRLLSFRSHTPNQCLQNSEGYLRG